MSNPLQTHQYVREIINIVLGAYVNGEISLAEKGSRYPLWLGRRLRRIVVRTARAHLRSEWSPTRQDMDAIEHNILDAIKEIAQ